jgi:thiol-disulfide isomerase/thioredoxin
MELAFWQRYAHDDVAATAAMAAVDSALPATAVLTPEDRQRIDAVKTQYRLLGGHLPAFPVLRSLQSPKARAAIPSSSGRATILVLFPDWCAHCRKMMTPMKAFDVANGTTPMHAYGLVFADKSIADIEGPQAAQASSANIKSLSGLPVLEIAPESVKIFGALDYPLAVALDESGIVRFVGVLPADALVDATHAAAH